MKTDSTIETMAVVTPNSAMERRNHTSSKRTLQKPERKKKKKYQLTVALTPCGSDRRAEHRENDRREHNGANADFSWISAATVSTAGHYVVAGFSPRSFSEQCVHKPEQNAG
jgi:hypothetical protein